MRPIIKASIRVIIVIVFLKLLYVLVNNASWIFIYPDFYEDRSLFYSLGILLAGFFVGTVILYFLWRKTDWLVRIFAGNLNENELVISTSNLDLIKVAMYVLGIGLLVTSIPELLGILAYHIRLTGESSNLFYSPEQQANVIKFCVTDIITILIGIWLVLGNKGIAKTIDKVLNVLITDRKEKEG